MNATYTVPFGDGVSRRRFVLAGGAAAGALLAEGLGLLRPGSALADPEEVEKLRAQQKDVAQEVADMRLQVEEASDSYQKALEEHDEAVAAVEETQSRIEENTAEIEKLQARLAERMNTEYREGTISFLDTVFESSSFEEFTTRLDMYDQLNRYDAKIVQEVKDLRAANEAEKATREEQEAAVRQKMDEAETLRQECEQKVSDLEAVQSQLSAEEQALVDQEQEAALAAGANFQQEVQIIGNPRNIEPFPEVVEYAMSRMGCPYVWAAAGPDTFDCSGLVIWSYAQAGMPGLPHYSGSLYELALSQGAVLELADVMPGDVLFRPGHVAIATGKGGVPYVHAPYTGAVVRNTDTLAYGRFVCGLRFPR